jgi:hypothetical protein
MLHNSNCIIAILKPHLCLNLPLLLFALQLYGCELIFNVCCVKLKCNEALLLYKSKTLPFIINIACLKKFEIKLELNKGYQKIEGFRELHNNTVPKKHDFQNNTPLNIIPLTHVSDGLYIECLPQGHHGKSYGMSLERGAGSGDDGSFLRVFLGAIFARPIIVNVDSYDRGYYYSLNFI